MNPAKAVGLIVMPFGLLTPVGSRNHVLDGVQIPTILRAEWASPGHVRWSIYSKWVIRGHNQYSADASWGVLDGLRIGATWQIRLNHPCAVAMRPYVKLLWPLVVAALCNRAGHYILPCGFFLLSSIYLFSSPNLSHRRLDVYHTSTHGVALVRI